MSRSSHAVELLNDWRDGRNEDHRHGWGRDCRRCLADLDAWDIVQLLDDIDPLFRQPVNGVVVARDGIPVEQ